MADKNLKLRISQEIEGKNIDQLRSGLQLVRKDINDLANTGKIGTKSWEDQTTKMKLYQREVNLVDNNLKKLTGTHRSFTSNIISAGTDLVRLGLQLAAVRIAAHQVWEAFKMGEESVRVDSMFRGTADELERIKKAAGGLITETELMQMSTWASNLNTDVEHQTKLLSAARLIWRATGKDMKSTFEGLVRGEQGMTRTLIESGVSRARFNELVQESAKQLGAETEVVQDANGEKTIQLSKLDSEMQARVRQDAMLKAITEKYGDLNNVQDEGFENTKRLSVSIDELKDAFGTGLVKGMDKYRDGANTTQTSVDKLKEKAEKLGDILIFLSTLNPFESIIREAEAAKWIFEQLTGSMEVFAAFDPNKKLAPSSWVFGSDPFSGQMGPPPDTRNWVDLKQRDITAKRRSDSQKGNKQEKKEKEDILDLVEIENKKLEEKNIILKANLGKIGAELLIRKEIKDIEERIVFLKEGTKGLNLSGQTAKTYDFGEINLPTKPAGITEHEQAIESLALKYGMLGNVLQDVGGLMGSIFNAPPEQKAEAWKNLFKMFANQLISFLEIQFLGAQASSIFQAIISGGLSLFKTMPEIIAGAVLLETLRGAISTLWTGTDDFGGGMALVGDDRGRMTPYSELVVTPPHSSIINNKNLQALTQIRNENMAYEKITQKAPVIHNHFRIDLNKGEFYEEILEEYLRNKSAKN